MSTSPPSPTSPPMSTSPTPSLATPYLDALFRRIWSAVSTLATWLARHPWPALVRHARRAKRDGGRFVAWLDRFLAANKKELAILVGLGCAGWGLALKWGAWLGLLVPGIVVTLAVLRLLFIEAAPPTPPTQRS